MPSVALALAAGLALLATPPATPEEPFARGVLVSGVACRSDPAQTYTLYLPTAYTPERRWPAMLVLDPAGRGDEAAERFRGIAEAHGWILLSSNDVHSAGPAEGNQRAVTAMWHEVRERVASDPRRIYAAGFSGGGIMAYALGYGTGGLAGVIASGARFRSGDERKPLRFPCFGAAGDADFNYLEMHDAHAVLAGWGTPERLEVFPGRHEWMPVEMAARAADWLELHAMRQGLRPPDPELVERFAAADLRAAEELERSGSQLDASRRLRQLAADLAELRPAEEVAALAARAERLAASPGARREAADRKRLDDEERGTLLAFSAAATAVLRDDAPPLAQRFEGGIGLDAWQRRTGRPGYEGVVARRVLDTYLMRCGAMLGPQMLAQGEPAKAALFLQVAAKIAPDRPGPRYNLACALARAGSRRAALEALEKAVELGFADAAGMAADADLATLREEPRFVALLAALRAGPGPAP